MSLQCEVADLTETFPSLPVSGTFLSDLPGFQLSSDTVLPSLGLPLWCFPYIFISATALMFFVSRLLFYSWSLLSVPPFLPPRSLNFSQKIPVGSHPLYKSPSSSMLLRSTFIFLLTLAVFRSSMTWLILIKDEYIYQERKLMNGFKLKII